MENFFTYLIGWIALCAFAVLIFGPEGLIVSLFQKWKEEGEKSQARRRAAKGAREREKLEAIRLVQQKKDEFNSLRFRVQSIVDIAHRTIAEIPGHLSRAESALSQSVEKLERRSFYPFWDRIEVASKSIKAYNESIQKVDSLRLEYAENLRIYKCKSGNLAVASFEPFPLDSTALPALRRGGETADRINQLYDLAHTDFEFSNIYANWRTNRTLVAGFQNLSSGLHEISEGLINLNFSVLDGFDAVSRSTEKVGDQISDMNDAVKSQTSEIVGGLAAGSVASSQRQIEMIRLLNNIQHGRVDLPKLNHFEYLARTMPKSK